ncbi:hypothetical protein JCM10207_003545 [Rhodosporidiobolus poonsookiae]
MARTVSWSSQGPNPRPSASTSQLASSSRLPPSTSTASLSGRPRQSTATSVLGYTLSSSQRRNGSPARGGPPRNDPSAGLPNGSPQAGMGSSSRFLLTVVPPQHLPHDPPHPRTNPQCSGYGPPEHFRRGTLVPLYPTLSSQLAAIAREYGLPSTGGLVLYLLSTTDPYSQGPMSGAAGFAGEGGPRINEAAWNLLWSQLFAEEEELLMLEEGSDSDDEDYVPPTPVPPLPLSAATLSGVSRAGDAEPGVFSDDNERVSQSSDAGASGSSVYSAPDGPKSRSNSSSAQRHVSANNGAGLGRGPPPSSATLPSPNRGKRFTSLPTATAHIRHSSRNSLRSASQTHRPPTRSSYMYPPPMSTRSTSYGSYSPSLASPLPGYGASVVVGKVEFDIHSSARGGKWYENWLAGATPSASSSAVSSALTTPATTVAASEQWQELHLPGIVASKTPQLSGLGFDEDYTPAPPVAVVEQPPASRFSTAEEDDEATPYAPSSRSRDAPDMRLRTASGQSKGMESAASSFSLAALAGHGEVDEDESEKEREVETEREEQPQQEEEEADSSIVDKAAKTLSRSSSSLPSRPVSNDSLTKLASSEKGTDDTEGEDEVDEVESAYEPLADEDDKPSQSQEKEDGSSAGSDYDEDEEAYGAPEPAAAKDVDPLGDVFESDGATWRSLADDETLQRRQQSDADAIETTGLGIMGARVASLKASAPEGVVERLPDSETLDEQGAPPVQDDVADVARMLSSAPLPGQNTLLASPIRLDSSAEAAEATGVFPPSPARGSDGEGTTSPFSKSHSTHTSISTVNFTVRPPSTIASMSPEFLPQRKQRQGWTNIPPVVDPSMSASSSLSSIAPLSDDNRASTIGLMENLDDLERALAELSPRAMSKPRMPPSPATILEEPSPAAEEPTPFAEQQLQPAAVAPPPRTSSSTTATATARPPPSLSSRPAFRYGMLSPPPDLTPPVEEQPPAPVEPEQQQEVQPDDTASEGLTADVPGYERDSPAEIAATTASPASAVPALAPPVPIVAAPAPEPTVTRTPSDPVRIPRSSSLNKPEQKQLQPQQVALPPSPLPEAPATLPEPALDPTPTLPPVGQTSWLSQQMQMLPPSPPRPQHPFAPPPPPSKTDDDLGFPAPPPRSPGPLRGLRAGKWGAKGKTVEVGNSSGQSKVASPDPNEDGGKSPLGAFFGKSTFGKAKGFFRRADCQLKPSSASLDSKLTSSRAATSPDAASPPPLPETSVVPSLPTEPVIPPRKESLDISASEATSYGRPRRPSVSAGSQPPSADPLPPFSPSLAANAAAEAASPRPPFLDESQPFDSFQTAQTTLSSEPSPAPSEPSSDAPIVSPEPVAVADFPPPPPIPVEQPAASPSAADFHLASPRSEYSPQTPRAGGSSSVFAPSNQYPASAPVTPADWRTPGGTNMARPRKGRPHRLSADIDQLLSQMNDFDFGLADDQADDKQEVIAEVAEPIKPVAAPSTPAAAPLPSVVEPEPDVEDAYGGGEVSAISPRLEDKAPLFGGSDDHGLGFGGVEDDAKLRVTPGHNRGQDSQGRPFPLSEDLSALGSMMTGLVASPPMSPESNPSSSYADYSTASAPSTAAPV